MSDRQLYTLRVWIEKEDPQSPWRALLEDSRTGDRRGFTHPRELVAFLVGTTGLLSALLGDEGKADRSGKTQREARGD